jgi:hypothetical protein
VHYEYNITTSNKTLTIKGVPSDFVSGTFTINYGTLATATFTLTVVEGVAIENTFNALTNDGKREGLFYVIYDEDAEGGYIKVEPNSDGTFSYKSKDAQGNDTTITIPHPDDSLEEGTLTTEDVDLYVNASYLNV